MIITAHILLAPRSTGSLRAASRWVKALVIIFIIISRIQPFTELTTGQRCPKNQMHSLGLVTKETHNSWFFFSSATHFLLSKEEMMVTSTTATVHLERMLMSLMDPTIQLSVLINIISALCKEKNTLMFMRYLWSHLHLLKYIIYAYVYMKVYTQWWLSDEECTCQCRKCRRRRFNPWVGKIPWRREWQSTPVFLPGESHRQRSLAG